MSCWHFRAELRDRAGLAAVLTAAVAGAALLPWIAGVPPPGAAVLTALALSALPASLGSVPGRWCPVKAVAVGPDGLRLFPGDVAATPRPATRVFPGLVLLHADAAGRRRRLWLPRSALPPDDYRRLKAFLLAARRGAGPAA